jgi:hypothetical protein
MCAYACLQVSSEEHSERVAEQVEARLETLAALKARVMTRRATQAGPGL